jgi:SAM-dependent methyltransferase
MDEVGGYEHGRDRMRSHECSHSLLVASTRGQNVPVPRDSACPGPSVTGEVSRRPVGDEETRAANRAWWDAEADDYQAEHGAFLGDSDFVWGPEGWTEAELDLLQVRDGMTVLEIGAGAAQCSRWLARHRAVRVVASDLSMGMLRTARRIEAGMTGPAGVAGGGAGADAGATASAPLPRPLPLLQCDGLALPLTEASVDRVFTAYGVVPFVADSGRVIEEAARVLRPGGRFVFSTSHPLRWAFPDDPGPQGLTATSSYFDRTPYVESESGVVTYAEHHRTLGDLVRQVVAAGLVLVDLVEPEWPERNQQSWGGWSPLRGALLPGTAILVAGKPAAQEPHTPRESP